MSNINAKDEFLAHVKSRPILCAELTFEEGDINEKRCELPLDYTEQDYEYFLKRINKSYDSGYGGQELFGTIWYKDGTWSDRGEYDGSEWWQHQVCPPIPTQLEKLKTVSL